MENTTSEHNKRSNSRPNQWCGLRPSVFARTSLLWRSTVAFT